MNPWLRGLRIGLALFFGLAGVGHFTDAAFFVSIVPSYLPFPTALVYLSGVAEIAGAAGLMVERTRRFAAWGLIGLLIAVFPANIDMALHPQSWPAAPSWSGLQDPDPVMLYLRLPMQFVLMAAVGLFTRDTAQK